MTGKAERNWAFSHHEEQTGGTKFPVKHKLRVSDADSRMAGGHVHYFPPKRKGAPVHVDELSTNLGAPGAGSALLDEVQARHPDSAIKFLHEVQRGKNTPSHSQGSHGEPTDWDTWHSATEDGIHRGFAMRMEPHHAQTLNDASKSKDEHLQALHEAMPEGPRMGMHWTTDGERAKTFAHSGVMDPRRDIPVVLHARGPERKDIETRPDHLFRNGVFPYDHVGKEREVPIRRGRKVEVTGMSWKPDADHPDADRHGWVHHSYEDDAPRRHTAAQVRTLPDAESLLRAAARDRDLAFHITASWRDVQVKAKRIRAEGGVTIVIASHDGVGGQVRGDHNTYESLLVYRPGTKQVVDWTCGCKWAAYAFDRSPAYRRFEGRKCSHALALQFEAQAQGMFGKEVHPAEPPRVPAAVRYDPDAGAHVYARPFAAALVTQAKAEDVDPAVIVAGLMRMGLEHKHAVSLFRTAEHEGGEHHCPHCGGFIGAVAFEHGKCPHCGTPLATEHHHHEGSWDAAALPGLELDDGGQLDPVLAAADRPGPSVSGIALKAHDTGRVLMLQRGLEDEDDPARGTWEFPGGHHEDGDKTSLHAGLREWEEEVGQPFPEGGVVHHTWSSPNGIYRGHVVVIPSEKDLSMKDGRVMPNPDDPKGDHHEQAAWWDIAHAKKNPALRAEVKAHTPWKEIEKASLDTAKTANVDMSVPNPAPGRMNEPLHSDSKNPGSTGWATGEDPVNWANVTPPQTLVPSLSFDGILHDEPEPALPAAYGDHEGHPEIPPRPTEFSHADLDPVPDDEPAFLVPDQNSEISLLQGGQVTPGTGRFASLTEAVQAFQQSPGAQTLMTGSAPQQAAEGQDDIAAAARAHLAKTALATFSPTEQRELITEGQGQRARNFGDLQVDGTHYALLDEALGGEDPDPGMLFL